MTSQAHDAHIAGRHGASRASDTLEAAVGPAEGPAHQHDIDPISPARPV